MPTITDALLLEHRFLLELFGEVERSLPEAATVGEVRILARLIERLLEDHAGAEKDLAYGALDHVLYNERRLDRMHQDHHEIDDCLRRAQKVDILDEARRLLGTAIASSRDHFRREERQVFPLIERVLLSETLVALGNARVGPGSARAA